MNLDRFMKEAHQLSRDKGWWDKPIEPHTADAKLMLIVSELAEAGECIRDNEIEIYYVSPDGDRFSHAVNAAEYKPEGLGIELGDAVIRCADFACAFNTPDRMQFETARQEAIVIAGGKRKELEADRGLATLKYLTKLVVATTQTQSHLSEMVGGCYQVAVAYGIDLDECIQIKHEYNKTRAYKHGGKLA